VTRGVCEIQDGFLVSVEELTAIERKNGRIINTGADGTVRELAADSPVSMNFWGFPPSILGEFKQYFDDFLRDFAADIPGNIKSECYIPRAADHFIKQNIIAIKALPSDSDWFGVTYREDREAAIGKLAELTAAGVYPDSLWDAS
jgi:hypothetical protein